MSIVGIHCVLFPTLLPRHSGCSNWRPHWFGSLNRFEAGKRPRNYIVKKNGSKQLVIQPPDLWYWNILGRFVECIFFCSDQSLSVCLVGVFVHPKAVRNLDSSSFGFRDFRLGICELNGSACGWEPLLALGQWKGSKARSPPPKTLTKKAMGKQIAATVYDKNHKK